MAQNKSPAFNFYSSDFLTGTIFMSNEQVGAYIKLMCLQHQKGHLDLKQINSITTDEEVLSKFKIDENGNYYNQRLEDEILKKEKYCESRANNRRKKTNEEKNICNSYEKDMKNICNSYDEHMENEIEIEIENNNIINLFTNYKSNLNSLDYEKIYKLSETYSYEEIKNAIEIAKQNNAYSLNYVIAVLNNLKNSKRVACVPEWLNKDLSKKEDEGLTDEEQRMLDEILEAIKTN